MPGLRAGSRQPDEDQLIGTGTSDPGPNHRGVDAWPLFLLTEKVLGMGSIG